MTKRILIGPTYLRGIEGVDWQGARVKYLKNQNRRHPESVNAINDLYYDAVAIRTGICNTAVDRDLCDFIVDMNRDPNCFFLAERERKSMFDGAFLAPVQFADCARYAWKILKEYEPTLIVFHNYPHEVFTYVLLKIALRLNFTTLVVHYSVLPWRMCISRCRKDGSTAKVKMREQLNDEDRASIVSYMKRLRSSHKDAMPATDVNWLAPNRSALSIKEDMRLLVKDSFLKSLARIYMKTRLYRRFRTYVIDERKGPYVAFLLHYQPEEATLPRGGIFAQQLNAILKLRSLLPADVKILVKENRATFRAPFTLATSVRNRAFYDAITSIPNVYLVPLERDTFELIDDALAVATITGSVGLEALCRGKRALIFGDATYKHFSGVVRLDAAHPDEVGISSLALSNWTHDPAATERDMQTEFLSSIGQAAEDNDTNFRSQQVATVEAVKYISSNMTRLVSQP